MSRYQKTGERETLEEICKQNERLIYAIVKEFRSVYAGESASHAKVIGSEDLKQDGFIGLIQAVKHYEPARGAAFSNVAAMYIKGTIMRCLNDRGYTMRLPVHKRQQLNQLRKYRAAYLAEHGHEPEIDEISEFIGLDGQAVGELIRLEIWANIASLNSPLSDDPEAGELCDTIPGITNPIEDIEESIYRDQVKEKLWCEVDKLETKQAAVLHRYFQDRETLKEIGECMGYSLGSIADMKAKALRQLKSGRCGRELRMLAAEYMRAETVSYKGVGAASYLRTGTSATERAAMIRMKAVEDARKNVMHSEKFKFIEAGLTRSERKQYYQMLIREKRKAEAERLAELKEEF